MLSLLKSDNWQLDSNGMEFDETSFMAGQQAINGYNASL